MDAPCKIQGSIHVFRLVNNMCPGKWVHIILTIEAFSCIIFVLQYWIMAVLGPVQWGPVNRVRTER